MSTKPEISFQQVLDALLDKDTPLNPRYLYLFSDLEQSELELLAKIWNQVPLWRRQALMEDLGILGDTDLLLSFEAVGRYALTDQDARVRALAVQILWEFESNDLVPDFLHLVETDADAQVRSAAATALGKFVYQGEIEELHRDTLHQIEDRLLHLIVEDEAKVVRQRALESLSFSSRKEVPSLIENAFATGDKDWMATALFAMGRSVDERWTDTVLSMLDHKIPLLRAEATRAAGELEIADAVPRLIELTQDSDEDVRDAAIWSLSQIGGEGVREIIESLKEEAEEDDEIDFLETALDNLSFTEDFQTFTLFDFSEEELQAESEELWEDENEELNTDEDEDNEDILN